MRKRFWRGFIFAGGTTAVILGVQAHLGLLIDADLRYWLRIAAVLLALTATLGRGGWEIQTPKNRTIIERIDRGMYVLSQLGATALLMFALLP